MIKELVIILGEGFLFQSVMITFYRSVVLDEMNVDIYTTSSWTRLGYINLLITQHDVGLDKLLNTHYIVPLHGNL